MLCSHASNIECFYPAKISILFLITNYSYTYLKTVKKCPIIWANIWRFNAYSSAFDFNKRIIVFNVFKIFQSTSIKIVLVTFVNTNFSLIDLNKRESIGTFIIRHDLKANDERSILKIWRRSPISNALVLIRTSLSF